MAKRPSKSSKGSGDLAWHVDFRNRDSLPDVKVVRTDFLINFVSIFLVVLLLGFFGYRQLIAWNVGNRIEELEAQVEELTPANSRNLRENSKFSKVSKELRDLVSFYDIEVPPLEFVVALTESRPEYVAYKNIEFRVVEESVSKKKTITYGVYEIRGLLKGSSAEDLEDLNEFRDIISGFEVLQDRVDSVRVPPPRRDPILGVYEFVIEIKLKPVNA